MAGVLVGIHWPALATTALHYDDASYVLQNPLVQQPSWSSAARFLTEISAPSTVSGYYQPLPMISLMLDWAAGGRPDHLLPFRRTSLLLHVLNAVLLFTWLRRLDASLPASGVAALLWGLHPIVVESSVWLSERKTLLATAFTLATLVAYFRPAAPARDVNASMPRAVGTTPTAPRRRLVLPLVLFAGALLSKPIGVLLPLILMTLEVGLHQTSRGVALRRALPFAAVALLLFSVAWLSQSAGATTGWQRGTDLPHVLLCSLHHLGQLLERIACPPIEPTYYPTPTFGQLADGTTAARVAGGALFVVLAAALWIVALLRPFGSVALLRPFATALIMFLLGVLPSLPAAAFSAYAGADKYAYWPLCGLALGAAHVIDAMRRHASTGPPERAGRLEQRALFAIGGAVLIVLALRTRAMLDCWRTTTALHAALGQVP